MKSEIWKEIKPRIAAPLRAVTAVCIFEGAPGFATTHGLLSLLDCGWLGCAPGVGYIGFTLRLLSLLATQKTRDEPNNNTKTK